MKIASLYGDSHSLLFKKFNPETFQFNLHPIIGSTISGLPRRDSTLQVGNKIRKELREVNVDTLCLKLGQVDIELGFFYKKIVKKQNLEITPYIELLVETYFEFINSLAKEFKGEIVVLGLNLPASLGKEAIEYPKQYLIPALKGKERAEALKQLEENFPGIKERTQQHLKFNDLVEKACENTSIRYADITTPFLDEKTGIIKKEFSDEKDHHYKGLVYNKEFNLAFEVFNKLLLEALK